MSDSEREGGKAEHVIMVESTQIHRAEVSPEMAELLTNDHTSRNIYGEKFDGQGPPLEFHNEVKITYQCSCGMRFRKGKTARSHLEEYRSLQTETNHRGQTDG